MKALEARLRDDVELAAVFDLAMDRHRYLRPELGIGGVRASRGVKCLHAHVAFALAAPPYAIGDQLLAAAGGLPATCCMEQRA